MAVRRGFWFQARMVRVVDADTIYVDPLIYPQDVFLRIRLKDRWEVELDEEGSDAIIERVKLEFPEGSLLDLTNTRSHWTHNRLEARVDKVP